MNLFNLFEGNEQAYNWHSDPEQRSMDATRSARLNREREPAGSEAIDARLRAQNDQLAQYAQSGQFWLKQKDTQQHISDAFTGKAAANAAALALLKQQPELKGNLVITAYGPGETQGVAEGSEYKSRHAHKQEQDKAYADYRTKHATSSMALMTRAEFAKDQRERAAKKKQGVAEGSPFDTLNKQALAAKKEKQRQLDQAAKFIDSKKTQPPKNKGQGVAEAPGAETLGHNQSTVSSNLSSLDLDEAHYDQGDYYNARRGSEYGRDMSNLGNGGSRFPGAGREDDLKGQSKHLPADPFGRTSGAVPRSNPGQVHHIALPGEVDEGEKIGNMDADAFDQAMSRLKKLAGAGPMKTVYDPNKRVYRNVPTAQQSPQQPKK